MKWVLRAVGTDFYIREDGSFTNDINEAFNLPSVKTALELCQTRDLIGMELVLRLGPALEATIKMGDVC
jgi:hypothetical protein